MLAHKEAYSVVMLSRVLDVSRTGFYDWRRRLPSQRKKQDEKLKPIITEIHQASRETYGYPRVHAVLKSRGERCGKHRIARLLKEAGLVSKVTQYRSRYAKESISVNVVGNKLDRQFKVSEPNKKWVTDITLIPTGEGWLHVAVVMDLFSRKVIGWAMSGTPSTTLVLNAIEMAIASRAPKEKLLLHSDQGVQFRSQKYRNKMRELGIAMSMSAKGECLDNAVVESFFHTLKTECVHHLRYKTRAEAKQSVFDYVEIFYNRQRLHSYLNYQSPEAFEKAAMCR